MWIIRVALERPYTFVVMALFILIAGPLAALSTATDIFPNIGIPVIGVAWSYNGLSPDDMAGRIVAPYERALPLTVNDIQHIESESLAGMGIVKIYFQPTVDIRTATAQVTSVSQTILKQLPPGIDPPLIVDYNASTVPILQVATSSTTLSQQQVLDATMEIMRPVISTVAGAAVPYPYGGKVREVEIDLDPQQLQAKHVSPQDVETAIAAQVQLLPAGTAKIGTFQYTITLNDSPETLPEINDIPIKTVAGATIYIHDVGHVLNGSPPQQSVVHVNGNHAVLTTILKGGSASTISVVQGVLNDLPRLRVLMPQGIKIAPLNNQSVFVKEAVSGVASEGLIAAALTSLMILLFLGSWRSSLIIAVSIPLAILCAVMGLSVGGQTLNLMTLGGLALAVGLLVDDATVTIENIRRHLDLGQELKEAIFNGANEIFTPAFVALLCICIVFVPMFTLPGISGYLFQPLAEGVVLALIASFILSRTLVLTMAMFLLEKPRSSPAEGAAEPPAPPSASRSRLAPIFAAVARVGVIFTPLAIFQRGFVNRFDRIRDGYHNILALALTHRRPFLIGFLAAVICSFGLIPFLGSNFFPAVDAGQMSLHVRPPVGTRIERSSAIFGFIEQHIRQTIPPKQLASIVDNIGLPISAVNVIYNNTGTIGYQDGDIYISLAAKHRPTADYMRILRKTLPAAFPGVTFSFTPADIVTQILNFGTPAPLDVQVAGPDAAANQAYALNVLHRMQKIPGIADPRLQQSSANPEFRVNVDRTHLSQVGLTEQDVTDAITTALAGSSQTAPVFWLDPKSKVSYPIVAQTPEYQVDTLPALAALPVTTPAPVTGVVAPPGASPLNLPNAPGVQVLGGLASIIRDQDNAVVNHYNIQPTLDLYATNQDRDLGAVAHDVQSVLDQTKAQVPKGALVTLRGQIVTMNTAFSGLFYGLLAAIVLVYMVIVINFQSWLDPFVIITALPAALAGIVWMLFVTHTTLSVPALTGALMCMGVATSNSILVVAFAREQLAENGGDALAAALQAGFTRFRPVLMTALAMIIGMVPMSLGLGAGGAQNAPLGRAVIGGLMFATFATLLFVPVVFSVVHGRRAAQPRTAQPQPRAGEAYA